MADVAQHLWAAVVANRSVQQLATWLSLQWQQSTNDNAAVAVTLAVSMIRFADNIGHVHVDAAIQYIVLYDHASWLVSAVNTSDDSSSLAR